MAIFITTTSRLNKSTLLTVDGIIFWDIVDLPEYVPNADDIYHQVTSSDRIDSMAYSYYSDAGLWWAIAWANNLEIFPMELNIGDKIIIPSPTYIKTKLFRSAK